MPITRLFRLVADPAQVDRFSQAGERNLTVSLDTEPGTLVMFSSHAPDDPSVTYVFEAYRDDDAYQIHAASPQFADYVAMASEVLTAREVFQTVPELLIEKPEGLRLTSGNDSAPRLAKVHTIPERDAAFREAVFANMRTSVAEEPGVLAMYAVTSVEDPHQWYFVEVYANEGAYAAHRETAHFKAYIASTADCVDAKELIPLSPDTIVSHGFLHG